MQTPSITQPSQVFTQVSVSTSQRASPHWLTGGEQLSVASSQLDDPLHSTPSSHTRAAPTHLPAKQTSSSVQNAPSSQMVPASFDQPCGSRWGVADSARITRLANVGRNANTFYETSRAGRLVFTRVAGAVGRSRRPQGLRWLCIGYADFTCIGSFVRAVLSFTSRCQQRHQCGGQCRCRSPVLHHPSRWGCDIASQAQTREGLWGRRTGIGFRRAPIANHERCGGATPP